MFKLCVGTLVIDDDTFTLVPDKDQKIGFGRISRDTKTFRLVDIAGFRRVFASRITIAFTDGSEITLAPEKMKEVVTFLESRRRAAFERLGRSAPQVPCFFEVPA